jgi:hypothetical protein
MTDVRFREKEKKEEKSSTKGTKGHEDFLGL